MQFKRTAVRTIIASRSLASAAGQAKTALISATAGPARSPAAASAIAPLSVLSGLKSLPKVARASSAVGIGKQILVIVLLQWGAVFPGAACVAALVDRFAQHCHVIDINADSWRQKSQSSSKKGK
jgi:hypothetical protein